MSNPLYYLAGLVLVLSYPTGLEPLAFARDPAVAGVPVPLAATAAAMALYGAAAWILHRRPGGLGGAALVGLRILALILFAAIIFVFHLPLWVWSIGLEEDVFAGGLLALSPLAGLYGVLALAAAWSRRRLDGDWTAPEYLRFALRGFAGMTLVPVAAVLGLASLFTRVPCVQRIAFIHPWAAWVMVLGTAAILAALLPPALRLSLGARQIEKGLLRERLERLARASDFRCGALLVVGGPAVPPANAFIAGLPPFSRWVFFTRKLLSGMSAGQMECVLAHEIAHVRKRHILHYVLLGAAFALWAAVGEDLVGRSSPAAALAAALGLFFVFWFLLFGFVSRRFETEADLEAARLVGGDEGRPFGGAGRVADMLVALARLNRVPLAAWSWRHFTLLSRIRMLLSAVGDPARGLSFERACGRLRRAGVAFFLAAAASLAALAACRQGKAEEGRRQWRAYEDAALGGKLMTQGRFGEAGRLLRAAIEGGADVPGVWLRLAECESRLGRSEAARDALERARRGPLTDPRERLQLGY